MTTNQPRNEDGGYGSSSLVGSDRAGLTAAIESREALRDARNGNPGGEHRPESDADLGRLARGGNARRLDGDVADTGASAARDSTAGRGLAGSSDGSPPSDPGSSFHGG